MQNLYAVRYWSPRLCLWVTSWFVSHEQAYELYVMASRDPQHKPSFKTVSAEQMEQMFDGK